MISIVYFREKLEAISYFEAISTGFKAVIDELVKK